MKTKRQEIGKYGEDAVALFLMKQGFRIFDRNYREKWGELDIVAEKDGVMHFVEVKTVSCETLDVSDETNVLGPADQMNTGKRACMRRIVQTYLMDNGVSDETPFQADLAMVWVCEGSGEYKIDVLWDVLL